MENLRKTFQTLFLGLTENAGDAYVKFYLNVPQHLHPEFMTKFLATLGFLLVII